tara:strand:- start:3 stop:260 length:258 start_codon:yes stop_codon:yes gene_type:complete
LRKFLKEKNRRFEKFAVGDLVYFSGSPERVAAEPREVGVILRIYDVEDSELLFSPYQSGRLYSVVWMRDNYVMEMRGKNIEKVYK